MLRLDLDGLLSLYSCMMLLAKKKKLALACYIDLCSSFHTADRPPAQWKDIPQHVGHRWGCRPARQGGCTHDESAPYA